MTNNALYLKRLLNSKYPAITVILIISIGVYLNTLSNGFVYDDELQVVNNPWIKDARFIPEIFTSNAWAFIEGRVSNYYRPLLHVIFMADYHIFGLKPWGFHLTNIIFHAGISVLVFLIASVLFNKLQTQQQSDLAPNTYNLLPAFIAAILFATHPIHTEAVAWVSGMPELSFTSFYLLSFYLYTKTNGIGNKGFILSLIFFFFSTLCKETALTLPILLFAYDYSLNRCCIHTSQFTVHNIIKRYLPYLIIAGIYFILRAYAIGGFSPVKGNIELSSYEYFINIFPLFGQYLGKLLLPINLNAFYILHPISSILEWKGVIYLILTLGMIFVAYFLRNMNKLAFFSLLCIVIPLLPAFYIPALGKNGFAERYLYLPSVGFVIFISLATKMIYEFTVLGRLTISVTISILAIVIGFYSIGAVKRNYIWKDNYTLWLDTVERSPDGAEPHNNLGIEYYNKGLIDKAMQHYQIALMLKPDHSEIIHNNIGNVYYDKDLIDKAVEHYQIALKLRSDYLEAHYNLGNAYYKQGWIDKAMEHYQIAVRLKPDYPAVHYRLGMAYDSKGLIDKAIEHYQIALKLGYLKAYYNLWSAYYNMGNVYLDKGLIDKAIEYYQIAIRLRPDSADAHNNLGLAYYDKGRVDDAIEEFKTALGLEPNYTEIHYNLGSVYKTKGLKDDAIKEFEIALRLKPDFTAARQGLESLGKKP